MHVITPTDRQPQRVLGVWAHPDDEAYLSAGFMAETVDRGGEVTVFALTDGEAGFGPDDPRPSRERAAERRAELRRAMAEIGVTDVRFLSKPDGALAGYAVSALVGPIADVMADVRPELTLTFGPDGMTGHADHVVSGLATTLAWMRQPAGRLRYAAKSHRWLDDWRELHDRFDIWMTEEPTGVWADQLDHVVRIEGTALDRKRRVLAHHASQTAGVAAAFGESTYRNWIAEEAFRAPEPAELHSAVGVAAWGGRWTPAPRPPAPLSERTAA